MGVFDEVLKSVLGFEKKCCIGIHKRIIEDCF
jgi:hypothetical protein